MWKEAAKWRPEAALRGGAQGDALTGFKRDEVRRSSIGDLTGLQSGMFACFKRDVSWTCSRRHRRPVRICTLRSAMYAIALMSPDRLKTVATFYVVKRLVS